MQLLLPAKAHFLGFELTTDVQGLADIGCTVFAIANPRFFPTGTLVRARRPLRLSSVTSDGISGGTHGAWIDLDIPTCDRVSGQWIRCPRIFVYSAGVTDTLIFGLPFFCGFRLIFDPVQGCLLPYECVAVQSTNLVQHRDIQQLSDGVCTASVGSQQCCQVVGASAPLDHNARDDSRACAFMLLFAAVFFCMGGSLGMLLCQIQDAMRQAEDVSATDLRAAGSPVCAGLCGCDVSCKCVHDCTVKGVRPQWHPPLLNEQRDVWISIAAADRCPCTVAVPCTGADKTPEITEVMIQQTTPVLPAQPVLNKLIPEWHDEAWWDQFMELLLSDAKGRLRELQSGQHVLRVRRLTPEARIPRRVTQGSVGYDLASACACTVPPFGKACIQTDIAVAVPPGTYARVAPRSGMALKSHIAVGAGVIDQDYRGGIGVVLFNHSDQPFEVAPGDRVAQLILERISLPVVQEVEHFAETLRDGKGFGSSGTASVRSQRHQERCQLCKLHSVTADELPLKNGINKDEFEAGSSPFEVELNDCTCQEEAASDVGSEDVGSEGTASTCTSQPPDCFAGGWGYEREYESPPPPPPCTRSPPQHPAA